MRKYLKLYVLLSLFLAVFTIASADIVSIGTGTASSSNYPIRGQMDYSYTQQIYSSSQINLEGSIEKISFYYISGTVTNNKDWTIFMGHTDKARFTNTSATNWVPIDELTEVFSGDISSILPATRQWLEITLDTPFDYNNSDNLVIAVLENTPGRASMSWGSFTSTVGTGLYLSRNTTPIDLDDDLPNASGMSQYLNRIRLTFPMLSAPLAPTLLSPAHNAINLQNPTMNWDFTFGAGETESYDFYFGTNPNPPLFLEDTTLTSYTLEDHDFDVDYYWNVVAKNAIGPSPASETRKFTTKQNPVISVFPYLEDFGTATGDWPPIEWTQRSGLYPNATGTSSQWLRGNWLNGAAGNNAAKINIASTNKYGWLITRPILLTNDNFELKFDLGLTGNFTSNPITYPTGQPDDRFLVIVSDNSDMSEPTLLREWNNQGSEYVYNEIPHTGAPITIELTGISGMKYFAFYGESTVTNGNNDLHLDNVLIREIPSDPILAVNTTDLDFGTIVFGETSETLFIDIENIGSGIMQLDASNLTFTGANADVFMIDPSALPISVASETSAQIPVYLIGTTAGDIAANLEITYGGETESVELSANVLADGLIIIGDGTSDDRKPFGAQWGYERSASIYKADELHYSGAIESISWNVSSISSTLIPYKIYLGETSAEQQIAQTFDELTADMTMVHEGQYTFDSLGWHTFELQTPFTLGEENLMVAVEVNYGGTGAGFNNYAKFYYTSTAGTQLSWNTNSEDALADGSVSAQRPNMMIQFGEETPIPQNYIISGNFSTTSWDLEDVIIIASAIDADDISYDANSGEYAITVPEGWSGIVTPTKDAHIIEPASREYANVLSDLANEDYIIKKDLDPTVLITYPENDQVFNWFAPQALTITWEAGAIAPELYEIKFNEGDWEEIGLETEFTTQPLESGNYYFAVRGVLNTPQAKSFSRVNLVSNNTLTHETRGIGEIAEVNFSVVIPEYIATAGDPVDLGGDAELTITGDDFLGAIETTVAPEDLTPIPNPAFTTISHHLWQLIGTGNAVLTFQNDGADNIWFAYVSGGAWIALELASGASESITVSLDAKDTSFEFALGSGGNPTLPVELSFFNAAYMVNENSVKLNWATESETQMLGYQIYRGTDTNLANASLINYKLVEASNSSVGDRYSFTDSNIEDGSYYYWLEAVSYSSSEFYGYRSVVVDTPSTPELPEVSSMSKAYPNPFRNMTNIDVAIKAGETGSFTIYNILGQAVYTQSLNEGNTAVRWQGRDMNGSRCGSGVYFYKLTTPTKSETKKMIIMK